MPPHVHTDAASLRESLGEGAPTPSHIRRVVLTSFAAAVLVGISIGAYLVSEKRKCLQILNASGADLKLSYRRWSGATGISDGSLEECDRQLGWSFFGDPTKVQFKRIDDEVVQAVSKLTLIEEVRGLEDCSQSSSVFRPLRKLPRLRLLVICVQAGADDGELFQEPAHWPSLTFLKVDGITVDVTRLKQYSRLPSLEGLSLAGTGVTDEALTELITAKKLKTLILASSTSTTEGGVRTLLQRRPDIQIVTTSRVWTASHLDSAVPPMSSIENRTTQW